MLAVVGGARAHWRASAPTLSWLARNYAVFDSFFASVPGPTYVNRLFAWSATSDGACVRRRGGAKTSEANRTHRRKANNRG